MNCQLVRENWHNRRDDDSNALIPEEEYKAHLDSCESCRGFVLEMDLIAQAFDDLAEEPVPVATAKRQSGTRRKSYQNLLRVAAAIVLAASGAWFVFENGSSNSGNPTGTQSPPDGLGATNIVAQSQSGLRIGLSLRGKSADHYLAMKKTVSVANVQMYWIYPTLGESGGE